MSQNECHIFISYATEDREYIRSLIIALNLLAQDNPQVKVWWDYDNIGFGDDIFKRINEGIKLSKYYILFLSHNYFKQREGEEDRWTEDELGTIYEMVKAFKDRVMIPIRYDLSEKELLNYCPLMANKRHLPYMEGMDKVAQLIDEELKKASTSA